MIGIPEWGDEVAKEQAVDLDLVLSQSGIDG